MTPLMTASFNGHVAVVCMLIVAHADIHSQDEVYGVLANQPTDYVVKCTPMTSTIHTEWMDSNSYGITGRAC